MVKNATGVRLAFFINTTQGKKSSAVIMGQGSRPEIQNYELSIYKKNYSQDPSLLPHFTDMLHRARKAQGM